MEIKHFSVDLENEKIDIGVTFFTNKVLMMITARGNVGSWVCCDDGDDRQ